MAKGIRPTTYELIQKALVLSGEPITTAEMQALTGLSRTTLHKVFDENPAFLERLPGRPARWRIRVR